MYNLILNHISINIVVLVYCKLFQTADERSWFATKFERGQKRDTFDYDPVASAVLMLKAQVASVAVLSDSET